MSSKGKKPQKTEEVVKTDIWTVLSETIVNVYVFAMLVIFPLYMENKYLNMGDAKYHFFKVLGIGFLSILSVIFVIRIASGKYDKPLWQIYRYLSVTDIAVLCFLYISIISYFASSDKTLALWGFNGWYMGLVSQIIFCLIYFFVSRNWKWNPTTIWMAVFAAAVVYLIAVLQRFDIDLFRLYENIQADGTYLRLDDRDIEKFVSTLGQTSWYSSYAVLLLPFGMFFYFKDDKLWARIFSGLFIAIGAASICTVNSDSAYIALALILLVFFWYSLETPLYFCRFLEIILMILGAFRLVGILQTLFPERMVTLISGTEEITKFVNHSNAMLILLAAVAVIYVFYRIYMHKHYDARMDRYDFTLDRIKFLRKTAVIFALVLLWLTVLLIILTTKHRLPEFLNKLYGIGFFTFDNLWGNCRGFNWSVAVGALFQSSPKDLLIGVGPDCFVVSMDNHYYQEVYEFWQGLKLACAHNEFLNMSVTEGLLGVGAYLTIFVSSAVRLAKCAYKEPFAIPCLAAILAYMGHNVFCYQTCVCTPIIFIIIGIGEIIILHTGNASHEKGTI